MAESRPRRGHGEDSIYYDQANHYWVAAVSLGYKGGKRVRRKVTGRTKTEVRTKLRDLRRDLDQQPSHDNVGNCDVVNTTPFQFSEKGARIHRQ